MDNVEADVIEFIITRSGELDYEVQLAGDEEVKGEHWDLRMASVNCLFAYLRKYRSSEEFELFGSELAEVANRIRLKYPESSGGIRGKRGWYTYFTGSQRPEHRVVCGL